MALGDWGCDGVLVKVTRCCSAILARVAPWDVGGAAILLQDRIIVTHLMSLQTQAVLISKNILKWRFLVFHVSSGNDKSIITCKVQEVYLARWQL